MVKLVVVISYSYGAAGSLPVPAVMNQRDQVGCSNLLLIIKIIRTFVCNGAMTREVCRSIFVLNVMAM